MRYNNDRVVVLRVLRKLCNGKARFLVIPCGEAMEHEYALDPLAAFVRGGQRVLELEKARLEILSVLGNVFDDRIHAL